MEPISGFFGKYRFLSNFWTSEVWLDGRPYPSVEAAYQAAKTLCLQDREYFRYHGPHECKQRGRSLKIRDDWEEVKCEVMKDLCSQKFRIPALKAMLLATGDAELIETNTWGDRYWGRDPQGNGYNFLGKILMEIRQKLRDEDASEEKAQRDI